MFGVVEKQSRGLGRQALAASRILREERAEMRRTDRLIVTGERVPGLGGSERFNGLTRHRLFDWRRHSGLRSRDCVVDGYAAGAGDAEHASTHTIRLQGAAPNPLSEACVTLSCGAGTSSRHVDVPLSLAESRGKGMMAKILFE